VRLQILTIARNTFVESIRQPIVFVLVMICGVLMFFSTWGTGFAMGYTESGEVSGDNKLLLDVGLATVLVCGVLLAAFIATAVVSREIENKTVLTVVSKPVSRPSVVLGKYLGVAGAILLALAPMFCFLLLGIRHGVMSTAADDPDQPVLLFGLLAIGGAFMVALWCNFFYGTYFSQAFLLVLAPAMAAAYIAVLLVGKKWHAQPIWTDFKPQIAFACMALTMAVLVLTAVATAVSTRLGQVMTIVVCTGVFLFGLLSNFFIGRHAFQNRWTGIVRSVHVDDLAGNLEPGGYFSVELRNPARLSIRTGDSFYYGPSPSGFPMAVAAFPRFTGSLDKPADVLGAETRPGLVVASVSSQTVRVRRVGEGTLPMWRLPVRDDYIFLEPTRLNAVALGAWAAIPNMHVFWMVDAISQNQVIPPTHLLLVSGYAAGQITIFLCLGVILFQKRDVG
jgi:ABC-type transport system involved in multi-copper enzyme maturation permease subunit